MCNPFHIPTVGALLLMLSSPSLFADGGVFFETGVAGSLTQTRQEVLLSVHDDRVTYVLSMRYNGDADSLAWVIPLPNTPTDVIAHPDDGLFTSLETTTAPTFSILHRPTGGGCGCGAGGVMQTATLVQVEASGQAGIFDWVALTSTGSAALRTWLNENGFAVPTSADPILDAYIAQEMHFLAVRINKASADVSEGQTEVPPLQFTVSTTRRFYPMAISQISAAPDTEVLIYVLADHKAEAANVTNAAITPASIEYDPASESLTNYEARFAQTLMQTSDPVLITEYAGSPSGIIGFWPQAPQDLMDRLVAQPTGFVLTRMRTVLTPAQMNRDFEFRNAPDDAVVDNMFFISASDSSASAASLPLGALLVFGTIRVLRRRVRSSACPVPPKF